MREKQENWQRIEDIIRWANMSVNYFARYIGLPRGENLYQIKRGNNGISLDVAERIVGKFPKISKLWVLTGEGDMFADNVLCGSSIPFYNVDVETGVVMRDALVPLNNLVIPQLVGCDFAMVYMGRAMADKLPIGSVVILKAIAPESIIPGKSYVIVSKNIVTLRIARAAECEDDLRLVALDRENFDDFTIKKDDIEAVYALKGRLIITN